MRASASVGKAGEPTGRNKVKNRLSRGFLTLALALIICGRLSPPADAVINYAVTSPWIASIVNFIGGTNVSVRCIGAWDSSGRIYSVSHPRAGEIVIALDSAEAAALRINKNSVNLRLLYESLALPPEQKYSAFFDPAMLPFVAQSVMVALSEADSQSYSFYQRRLAEFQSRIDSMVEIGRHMLGGMKLLDLTGVQGVWLRAAMPGAVRPPADVWKSWIAGDAASLQEALAEAGRRGWLILLDSWTPRVVRDAAVTHEKRLTLPAPVLNQDCITFLHDIFITVSQKNR